MADAPGAPGDAASPARPGAELFLVSLLILFLELACIRWFPAHVLFLTFFTNVVLLAAFVGMSVGCLAAGRPRRYLAWTPALLLLGLLAAHRVERLRARDEVRIDATQASTQMVFFGTEAPAVDVARFVVPVEAVAGFFFLAVTLAFLGPGQELGRALARYPNRVGAYTVNVAGSVVGIALFALFSWLELPPLAWFGAAALGLAYLLRSGPLALLQWTLLALVVAAASLPSSWPDPPAREQYWSPYYRIDYEPQRRNLQVNLIGHQEMIAGADPHPAYALPHLLQRDSGGPPFKDVLIIGAGSGNDVSRALQWGATHVDAVEIDPVIHRLGRRHHPDRPYDDPRVTVHLDDGRNFLRAAPRTYDLIVYALVDSLVLHSSYSNIRLESYLFTEQAFRDVRRRLKPGGVFVMYNFFRRGWVVGRCERLLADVFGRPPLVLPLPYQPKIGPEDDLHDSFTFTLFFAGDTGRLRDAFARSGAYWLPKRQAPAEVKANGFRPAPPEGPAARWHRFGLAEVEQPAEPLRPATDDWPFLYLRRPLIPEVSLRGMALMAGLSLLLLAVFRPRGPAPEGAQARWRMAGRMFFLGAGFMLVETKAVVHMALLFGSTWVVNSVVFFAVLVMILAANLFVLRFRPTRLLPFYVGLVASLALNALVPLDYFLGTGRAAQVVGSCLLVFTPIGFAAVVFAVSFARSAAPDHAFGANIGGALLGGLTEYASMLLGFQYLVLVALGLYVLAISFPLPPVRAEPAASA